MEEIWKDIPGYEGYYQASSFGRIKTLDRLVSNGKNSKRRLNSRICSLVMGSKGYLNVSINKEGRRRTIDVHKLVAMAFLDHVPNNFERVVNHIDFNRLNNKPSNIELTTQRKNSNKKHLKSTSKYTGVKWHKSSSRWRATIVYKGETEYLGDFKDESKASMAYEARKEEIERVENQNNN
jgi:hypothetical protein